jgi:uncharacterized protein (TIGR00299 family) protein
LIEPFGGFAGDMFLASLLDLGDSRFQLQDLQRMAAALVPGEAQLEATPVKRGAFAGTHLSVRTTESADPPHRHLSHLREILFGADLAPEVQERTYRVLERLAEAEGRVHGLQPEEVHFHEVGAVDTLIDLCGAFFALQRLEVTDVFASPPLTGTGSVTCAHGEMPVPVPAVVEIMRGRPMRIGGGDGERLTPTGAALLAELVDSFECPGLYQAEAIGMGAGTRDPDHGPANMVRVQLSLQELSGTTTVSCLEVHLDDASGEEVGWCLAGLRAADALDVWCSSVQMKKGRPGFLLSALCREEDRPRLEAVIFERTSSLGLRWSRVERTECERRIECCVVDGVEVRIKVRERPAYVGRSPFSARDVSPEFDDLQVLAEKLGSSLREAEEKAVAQFLSAKSSS